MLEQGSTCTVRAASSVRCGAMKVRASGTAQQDTTGAAVKKYVSRCESPDSQIILYSTIVEISIFHSIPFYSIDYLQELHLSSCRIGTFCVRCFLLTSATTSCHIQQETARPTLATLLMPQTKEVTRFCPSCPWLDMAYQRL